QALYVHTSFAGSQVTLHHGDQVGDLDFGNVKPGTVQFATDLVPVGENAGSVSLTVQRLGGSDGPLTVHYATADGTAHAGTDYTAVFGTLTFGAGDTTAKTITVPVLNDHRPGTIIPRFTVTLSGLTPNVALGNPHVAEVAINEADNPVIEIAPQTFLSSPAGTQLTNAAQVVPPGGSLA